LDEDDDVVHLRRQLGGHEVQAVADSLLELRAGHLDHGPIITQATGTPAGDPRTCRRPHPGVLLLRRSSPYAYGGLGAPRRHGRPNGPPSSSGLGPRPFTAVARVRIPLGVRTSTTSSTAGSLTTRPRSAVG